MTDLMTFHKFALPKIQRVSLADALAKSVRIGGYFDTSTLAAEGELFVDRRRQWFRVRR
jgi:hypothetical protein